MRIIGGEARGRKLQAPKGVQARPTADRVREAIFNILGQRLAGGHVLDLYAGSGALGLEALSRGAERATFVEQNPEAARLCATNLSQLGYEERGEILRDDALHALKRLADRSFDWIFLDPPYDVGPNGALQALASAQLPPEAVVVAEHDAEHEPDERYGTLRLRDRRRYGSTFVSIYESETEEMP